MPPPGRCGLRERGIDVGQRGGVGMRRLSLPTGFLNHLHKLHPRGGRLGYCLHLFLSRMMDVQMYSPSVELALKFETRHWLHLPSAVERSSSAGLLHRLNAARS